MSSQSVVFERAIQAPPDQVYHAFTNATALREWLVDVATVEPRVGGRFYVCWNSGFYAAGEYTALEPGKRVAFSWHGRGEPGATQVQVSLEALNGRARLRLEHSGFGAGAEWQKSIQASRDGWSQGLENLASVLETGQDLRITRRPMLGITLSDFNAEIAAQLGVPVNEGVRVDGTLEGMGARKAGLQQHDVIVAIAGQPIATYANLAQALQGRKAGEVIEVVFYRGAEKHTVHMELSARPIPEIPFDPKELAAHIRRQYDELNAELAQLFEGVTDAQASARPAPGEWSALEVVAHLMLGERYSSMTIAEAIGGQERWADDYGGNIHEQLHASVVAYPTIAEMLEEYRRNQVETLTLIENLPAQFVARKGSYWRTAYSYMEGSVGRHNRSHYDQIRAAIQAAKQQ